MTGTARTARGWLVVPVVLLAAGAWAIATLPGAPPLVAPPPVDLPATAVARAEAYARPLYAVRAVGLVVRLAAPLAWVLTPGGRRLLQRLAGPRAHDPRRAALVAVAMLATADVVLLPANWWFAHVRESRLGFRTAGALDFLRDWVLAVGVELGVVAVAAAAAAILVHRRPATWRWPAAALAAGAAVLGTLAWPLVVTPLFNRATPLEDAPLRARIAEVVAAAEDEVGRDLGAVPVEQLDASRRTTRRNALVTGVGPTLRIQVYDTLVGADDPTERAREVELAAAIVAHELGHATRHDTLRATALGAAAAVPLVLVLGWVLDRPRTWRLVAARGPSDPRLLAVGLAAFVVVQALATPVGLAVSRRVELAADQFALDVGADPRVQADLHVDFVVRDLSPPDRPAWVTWLLSTHPTPRERIERALAARRP